MGQNRKDKAFFDAFSAHAGKSREAAALLGEMFAQMRCESASLAYAASAHSEKVPAALQELAVRIKSVESAGDVITHETVKRLHETWITPLDRDDIHQLIGRLDDVLDEIEAVAGHLVLFEIAIVVAEARKLAEILVGSCAALAKAIDLLSDMGNAKAILELCVEVNRLENAADETHRKAIGELFRPGNDLLAIMKWRDIFDGLEAAADRCEDVADTLEGVVLEYA